MQRCGLAVRKKYTEISDCDLTCVVHYILTNHPTFGHSLLMGYLVSNGVHVQRTRLRKAITEVKELSGIPVGKKIKRRQYHVRAPLSLWHIDGNHKLLRWGFVIHGCIDGYSRLVTFLELSTDNCASTVLKYFKKSVVQYGMPSRVRVDKGGENVGVCRFIEEIRGKDRNSYITGKSVHNTRIERLWRDVFQSCTGPYHQLFSEMENSGILDLNSELDVYCIQLISIPILQRALENFKNTWNSHKIRTEGHMSPNLLFVDGLARLNLKAQSTNQLFTELLQETSWDEQLRCNEDRSSPEPRPGFYSFITAEQRSEILHGLSVKVNDAELTDLISLYLQTKEIILHRFGGPTHVV